MSDNPFDVDESFDAFAPTALDEETELRALAQAILLAEDFKLIFVRCNQPQQRQRLISLLRERLPEQNVQEIHLREVVAHLLDALRERLADSAPDTVFVTGIEYSLPVAAEAHATPFVLNLNAARNSFSGVIRCPLVLWVPEYVLNAFMLGAPDFFSIRSGVYFFAAAPRDTTEVADALTAGTTITVDNLSLPEKQERVTAIRSLLADYEALPAGQRDLNTEKRLHSRLGDLLFTLGLYDSAQQHYQYVLDTARKTNDQSLECTALIRLGKIDYRQGRLDEAIEVLERSLRIAGKIDDATGKAAALGSLANVYYYQQRWEETRRVYEQCIEIHRALGDRSGEGLQLGNLALVLVEQGEYEAAEESYRRSIGIARETGNQLNESRVLSNLGAMYADQGRLSEAEEAWERSLEIARRIGHREDEWVASGNLARLRVEQGALADSIELQKQTVEVLKKMDDTRNLAQEQELLRHWEQRLAAEQRAAAEPSTAS